MLFNIFGQHFVAAVSESECHFTDDPTPWQVFFQKFLQNFYKSAKKRINKALSGAKKHTQPSNTWIPVCKKAQIHLAKLPKKPPTTPGKLGWGQEKRGGGCGGGGGGKNRSGRGRGGRGGGGSGSGKAALVAAATSNMSSSLPHIAVLHLLTRPPNKSTLEQENRTHTPTLLLRAQASSKAAS